MIHSLHRKILDVGCGAGELYDYIKFDPQHYLGVDFSNNMLKTFKERHPEVDLKYGEASTLMLNEKFDFIIVNNVIQYCNPITMTKSINNIANMLAEGGTIFLGNIPIRIRS